MQKTIVQLVRDRKAKVAIEEMIRIKATELIAKKREQMIQDKKNVG